jgi:F-type H+-transporting ATPase subunit b
MEPLYLAGIVEGLKTLGINLPSLLAQLINFTILLVVLYLLAYKPLLKYLDERRRRIQEGLEASEQAKQRLARAEEDVTAQMERARQEGQTLIGQAQQVAARIQ